MIALLTRPSLRVLIANEHIDRLGRVAAVLKELGHEVVARTVSVADVAATTASERPDVAIVGLGDNSDHALELVSEIVRESYCPVIALLEEYDGPWVQQAAERGVFAYIIESPSNAPELQSAIDITLCRFAEVQSLKDAVARRTLEADREKELSNARRLQALELHDGVVQGLVTAQLAHDLGRQAATGTALTETLARAKNLVNRSVGELRAEGLKIGELIDGASRSHQGG